MIKFEFWFRFSTNNYTRINDMPVKTGREVIYVFVWGTRNFVCTLIYKVVNGVVPDSLTCTENICKKYDINLNEIKYLFLSRDHDCLINARNSMFRCLKVTNAHCRSQRISVTKTTTRMDVTALAPNISIFHYQWSEVYLATLSISLFHERRNLSSRENPSP